MAIKTCHGVAIRNYNLEYAVDKIGKEVSVKAKEG